MGTPIFCGRLTRMLVPFVLIAMVLPISGSCQSCPTALAEGVLVSDGARLELRAPSGETNAID